MVATVKEGFPVELIRPEMSVLCLFSAAFCGENDVKFIHEAGCRNVILVDNDKEKLLETALKYRYVNILDDILQRFESGKDYGDFDVIISDQWNGGQEELIHGKYFKQLLKTAKKLLILSCSEKNMQGRRKRGKYYLRNEDYLGGIYWRVIKK